MNEPLEIIQNAVNRFNEDKKVNLYSENEKYLKLFNDNNHEIEYRKYINKESFMHTIKLNLTEDEIKKVKKEFNNGQVYTDGCFCGHAVANFRDNLYVLIDFSCRKSMSCESSYYEVTGIMITEKASKLYSDRKLNDLLKKVYDDSEDEISTFDDRKFTLVNSYYDDATHEDVHLICEGLELSDESLKAVQKKLFKYYKKTYGEWSDAKFKDVGHFKY